MKEPLFSIILKYALYVAFVSGIALAATLPLTLDRFAVFMTASPLNPSYRAFILPFLMIVAIPSLWIVLEMIFMLRTISRGPFVLRNVAALYRIGIIFLVLAAAFFVKSLLFLTFLTMVCLLLFICAGLFSFTLAALIRQSVIFREENDLTI